MIACFLLIFSRPSVSFSHRLHTYRYYLLYGFISKVWFSNSWICDFLYSKNKYLKDESLFFINVNMISYSFYQIIRHRSKSTVYTMTEVFMSHDWNPVDAVKQWQTFLLCIQVLHLSGCVNLWWKLRTVITLYCSINLHIMIMNSLVVKR